MSLKLGTSAINKIYLGSTEIKKMYLDSTLVYDKSVQFLLDLYPATVAYSLRQLRTGVTNVIRVRRSSDNVEQDFTPTQITNGTLLAFCGAGNGSVAVWYDQSGNGYHATNATLINQPLIVQAGVLITDSGQPAVQFFNAPSTGNPQYTRLNSSNININFDVFSSFHVMSGGTPVNYEVFFALVYGTSVNFYLRRHVLNNNYEHVILTPVVVRVTNNLPVPSQSLQGVVANRTVASLRVSSNGVLQTVATAAAASIGIRNNYIVRLGGDNVHSNAKIQETILYNTDQTANRTDIEANINSYYTIY